MTREEFIGAYNIGYRDGKAEEYNPTDYDDVFDIEQEPKTDKDCISRQAALSDEGLSEFHYYEDYAKMRNYLKSLPPVNPQQKTGYWFEWKPENDVWRTTCSECGEETRILWDYCPHCGAKMASMESEVEE